MSRPGVLAAWLENAFFVLGLGPEASRLDVERTGQKLLGLLTLGNEAVRHYGTPLGPAIRDAERVRAAVEQLRDPRERVVQELLAGLPPLIAPAAIDPAGPWMPAASIPGWTPDAGPGPDAGLGSAAGPGAA